MMWQYMLFHVDADGTARRPNTTESRTYCVWDHSRKNKIRRGKTSYIFISEYSYH